MMTICYSYLLSLLFLLLIIHWTNSASLRSFSRSSSKWSLDRRHPSFIINNEVTTSEPILSRRRPQLISSERRRRWSKDDDNDEVEIPIDNDISSFNSTMISTIVEVEYPLLRQDLVEINQTDELTTILINEEIKENNKTNIEQSTENIFPSTISNEIIDINTTESEILPTNVTDINQIISNEKNESIIDNLTPIEIISNETETSSIPISINQTIEELSTMNEFKQDTTIILLDYTTIPSTTTNGNQTSIDSEPETISEYNTTVIHEDLNTTTSLNVTQSDRTSIQERIDDTTMVSDITQNDTSTMVNDEGETISFLPETTTKPICDRSCQCLKECPYGFEIINNTCQCDPPCKNYQCFGNDTCTVSKKGQPLCQPEKGIEHDRPIRCYQPRDAGSHDAYIRYYDRWYYNPDQNECHLLVYRGLGGNENNFQTLNDCHLECITCAASPDPGTCLGFIRMWYYDYKKKQCSQFEYSGCKGNENKFLRKQDCIDTCITRILNI